MLEPTEVQQDQVGAAQTGGAGPSEFAKFRAKAAGLSAKAKESGNSIITASVKTAAATAEGLKRLALGDPVQGLCKAELSQRPCPQLVVMCCTALASNAGLATERIFKHDPPHELVERLAHAVTGRPLSLIPPGTSPHAVAALLKHWLSNLPEPLLTYRLLPEWLNVAAYPDSVHSVLQQMPAANLNVLRLLLELCSFINTQSAVNEMDALALAEVLAPCVAWRPAPKPQPAPVAAGPGPFQRLAKALSHVPKVLDIGRDQPAAGTAGGTANDGPSIGTAASAPGPADAAAPTTPDSSAAAAAMVEGAPAAAEENGDAAAAPAAVGAREDPKPADNSDATAATPAAAAGEEAAAAAAAAADKKEAGPIAEGREEEEQFGEEDLAMVDSPLAGEGHQEWHRKAPLEELELKSIVIVLDNLILHFEEIFGLVGP